MGYKNDKIQSYLEEGLVALLPSYEDSNGDWGGVGCTQVVTLQGVHGEQRSLSWLVEVLARFHRLDLAAVRRHTGRLLRLRHHIPLPLAEGLVLLPVKVRQTGKLGEQSGGYVNLMYVERVEEMAGRVKADVGWERGNRRGDMADGAAAEVEGDYSTVGDSFNTGWMLYKAADRDLIRCRIICRGGLVICCLNTAATVRTKLLQGEAARQELLQRQKVTALPAAPFAGLDGATLRELLPSCDCLLRSLLLLLLDKAARPEPEPEQRETATTTGGGKR